MPKAVRLMLWGLYIAVFSFTVPSIASCGGDPNAMSGCGSNCGRRCSNYDKGPVACPLSCRLNGCDCRDGYVYDDNIHKCVRPEKCTPVCGQNEQYTSCVEGGCVGARNCSEVSCGQTVPVICKKLDPAACTAGCVCREGFLRNDNGICVAKDECPLNDQCSGKPYQFWDTCPPMCFTETCAGIGKPVDCPPQAAVCRPRCRCAQEYYRNSKGVCVPQKECKKCGKNEVYDKCVTPCPPRTCGINDAAVLCAPTNPDDCKEGCRCADGFYRNDKGECVAWKDCPKCPKHEVYDPCPNPCPAQLCSVDESVIRCAAPPNLGDPECKPGCRCEEGYKRNDKGVCIPKDQCPQICRGANEFYDPCPSACDYDYCEDIGKESYSPRTNSSCKGRCRCKPGYLRNKVGDCIKKENCLKCTGPHEFFACGGACDNVCATLKQQNQTNCPIINIKCNEMCYCEKDYARNSEGICVPISSCPKKCGKNEVYDKCVTSCPPRTCGINDAAVLCAPTNPDDCKEGCRCADGFYRNDKAECVAWKDCPKCPKHEVYDPCPNPCPAQLCSVDESVIRCAAPPNLGDPECKPGCRCEEGYKRNDKGVCIPKDQCPQICRGANEFYDSCPSACDYDYCEDIGKESYSPRTNSSCKGRCRCKPGYLRNKVGDCIKKENCLKCTGPHEFFACGGACDNVCATLKQQNQTHCPIINIKCNEMCYCEKDYARNSEGICVPISSCPNPPCPKGQIPGCGNNCNRKCINYRNGPSRYGCPRIACRKDSLTCQCDPSQDYYYDDNRKQCVHKSECP